MPVLRGIVRVMSNGSRIVNNNKEDDLSSLMDSLINSSVEVDFSDDPVMGITPPPAPVIQAKENARKRTRTEMGGETRLTRVEILNRLRLLRRTYPSLAQDLNDPLEESIAKLSLKELQLLLANWDYIISTRNSMASINFAKRIVSVAVRMVSGIDCESDIMQDQDMTIDLHDIMGDYVTYIPPVIRVFTRVANHVVQNIPSSTSGQAPL